ncbi:alpha/beta hydrolase family protein [Sandaracinus amylolyticus]|uniref:S9 family peptidase n=1 Tax=Sandaracinus amylolyticus TaxID=927083 RepID=UPI001F19C90B|nr:S9 family peptidase [Sandaracinus amylolyticus]UJR84063.1 Hypothetical protein I5071_61340 [Sandaracinus amylolyticus]
MDVETLTTLGRLAEIAPSPDGTWLAAAIARPDERASKYVHDLWRIPLDGRPATRLTHGPSNDRAPRFRHDGALLFLSNRPVGKAPEPGDDQRAQVWMLPPHGEPQRVTDEPLGVDDFLVAQHADVMIVRAPVWPDVPHDAQRAHAREIEEVGPRGLRYRALPVRHWDAWVPAAAPHLVRYDTNGGGRVDVTPRADREHREVDWDLSSDGRTLVIGTMRADVDRIRSAAVRVIDVESGSARDLGVLDRTSYSHLRLSPDGTRVAAQRERRREGRCDERALVVIDLASGSERVLASRWDRWPIPEQWDAQGESVVCTADDEGRVVVARIDVERGEHVVLAERGSFSCVRRSGARLVAIQSTLFAPPRAVIVGGAALADPSGFDASCIEGVRVETFEVQGADGAQVRTMLVLPRGEGPHPTLLWIHGGPISQWADGWHWRWNPLVAASAGYAVALPNPRGSTGHGHAFVAGVWGDWGGRCFDDLMRVTDALAARDDVDASRIAAMGGSFGGYMTSWIAGRTDRFRALVTHAGLFDLRAFYGTCDHPATFGAMMGATPWQGDVERHSPHAGIGEWRTPTLVVHGEKDYRVPIGEALALFESLQAHGVESELLVFPDEGHWIQKPRNVRQWYAVILEYLARHLR